MATFAGSHNFMQAEFEMKVQVIRSKGRATRLFVNVPLPLAAALDLQAGERVRWQLLARSELRLIRLEPPPTKKHLKK
jgi:hypothetical protein